LIINGSYSPNFQKNEEAYLRYIIRSRQTLEKLNRIGLDLEGANVVKRASRTLERYNLVPIYRISARLKRDYKGYISKSLIDRYSEDRWKEKKRSY
jgi:hypothetical protein